MTSPYVGGCLYLLYIVHMYPRVGAIFIPTFFQHQQTPYMTLFGLAWEGIAGKSKTWAPTPLDIGLNCC